VTQVVRHCNAATIRRRSALRRLIQFATLRGAMKRLSRDMFLGEGSMEGHFQAELEATAPVTACKPHIECDKCLSGEVQDTYFIAQRVKCLARSFHLPSLVLTLLNKVTESQMRCAIVMCLKSFRNDFLVIIVDICFWFERSN